MKQLWKKASEGATLLIILAVVLLCAIIIIPAIPFVLVYAHLSDKQFQKRYHHFLARMDGACFFCYNSRKSSVEYARDVIVPALAPSIHVVFVDGNKVIGGAESDCMLKMLGSITERKSFPYLLKIENGQVLDLSVNNQFYSIMISRKPIAPLLQRIDSFFDNTTSNPSN
jgi:hypothetical protein